MALGRLQDGFACDLARRPHFRWFSWLSHYDTDGIDSVGVAPQVSPREKSKLI
ncbi:hypothetical protein U91I_01886 [alpha proteobacterium U9-1i]|nr:hypothetical protein U91I_01886 [alpha proteobacterium U9-1i]